MTIGIDPNSVPTSIFLGDMAFQNADEFISSFGSYTASATAPATPSENDIWFDTVNGIVYRYYVDANSGQWAEFTGGIAGFFNTNSLPTSQGVTVEVNLGSTPARGGNFTVSGAFILGRPVQIFQAPGPYTGKGSLYDESEMDAVFANAVATGVNTLTVYWTSQTFVKGNIKFTYVPL